MAFHSPSEKKPLEKKGESTALSSSRSFTIEQSRTINEHIVKCQDDSIAGNIDVYPLLDGEDAFLLDNESETCLAMHMRYKLPNVVRFFSPDKLDKKNVGGYKFIGDLTLQPELLENTYEFRRDSNDKNLFHVQHTTSVHRFVVSRDGSDVASYTVAADIIEVSMEPSLSDQDVIILLGIVIATCHLLPVLGNSI